MSLKSLQSDLRAFAEARGWLRYHTPKNLALAIASEAGELLHCYRWENDGEQALFAPPGVADELADVMIFALRMADELGIDLEATIRSKVAANAERAVEGPNLR